MNMNCRDKKKEKEKDIDNQMERIFTQPFCHGQDATQGQF